MTEPTTTPAEGFKTPAMIARLEEFAREFDVPMPPLAYEDGHLLLDDPLHDWHVEHDAPLDWTLRGDVRTLLRVYRRHYEEARPVKATIGGSRPMSSACSWRGSRPMPRACPSMMRSRAFGR